VSASINHVDFPALDDFRDLFLVTEDQSSVEWELCKAMSLGIHTARQLIRIGHIRPKRRSETSCFIVPAHNQHPLAEAGQDGGAADDSAENPA
jgi:hypothetical protein